MFFLASILTYKIKVFMANLFPSIFPYAQDSPEMKKLGMQTEFEVYTKLGSTYDETVDFCVSQNLSKEITLEECVMENIPTLLFFTLKRE